MAYRLATLYLFPLLLLVHAPMAGGEESAAEKSSIDFGRDIQPLLSENCYFCHGPDEKNRQADLRLDEQSSAEAVIVPGKPEDSELYLRITSADPDALMPPPDSHRTLKGDQIALIRQWVVDGAQWSTHWSFAPIKQVDAAADQAIDRLVTRRLAMDGLELGQSAPRRTLIRRVSLDLTGLPPTLEEVDVYLNDDSRDAYRKMVERYLASPQYGERMAWDWMDVARYADSNGYQGDNERTMWPWRDWVVRAYNDNMPFDQFSTWQLAGDLLDNATDEQKLATGFLRNHPINGEGGRIAEENRVDYVMDMSETTGTVWMGLTLNCCRCHDHKYDPLTQLDYYGMFGFFNQTPVDGGGGSAQTPPVLVVPSAGQLAEEVRRQAAWDKSKETFAEIRKPLAAALAGEKLTKDELQKRLDANGDFKRAKEQRDADKKRLDEHRRRYPKVMVMADREKPRKTFRLDRGSYEAPREEVAVAVPRFLGSLGEACRRIACRWLVGCSPKTTR